MSLILFGLLEIGRLFMAREVVNYAATVGARAHAVGFNDFMIYKTVRVAGIPAAGKIRTPQVNFVDPNSWWWTSLTPGAAWSNALVSSPSSMQYDQIEESRIPLYLAAENMAQLDPVLNYEDWDDQNFSSAPGPSTDQVTTHVDQDVRMKFYFYKAFWGQDYVREKSDATQDSHYSLYLQ